MNWRVWSCCLAGLLSGPPSVLGQVICRDVAEATGLRFTAGYGDVFDFTGPKWSSNVTVMELMQRNMGTGAAVGDYDNDGDLDVYLLGQLGQPNALFRNDPAIDPRRDIAGAIGLPEAPAPSPARTQGDSPEAFGAGQDDPVAVRFTDVTGVAGVVNAGYGRSASFTDLDNDGWLDLIVVNDSVESEPYPPSALYRNNADGTFTDVTAGSGFMPWGLIKGGLGVGDYDGDGWLDICVTFWTMEFGLGSPFFPGHNRLYRNLGNFQFEDVTASAGLGVVSRDSFTPVLADFDDDGDPDLFIAVDHTSDLYYRNDGGVFVNQTFAVGATHSGNDMGVAVGDIEWDGDLDLYCTNITDPDHVFGGLQYNTLLVNRLLEPGINRFTDEAGERNAEDTLWGWGTVFVDIENDGDLDLYAVNGFDEYVEFASPVDEPALLDSPAALLLNDGAGVFSPAVGTGADVRGDSRAVIAFDMDRDGDQDLLVTNVNQPAVLLENRGGNGAGHWLDIRLVGGGGVNRDGIGSRIEVTTGAVTRTHQVLSCGSYLAGIPAEVHVGLGAATVVDEIVVTWTDGAQTVLQDVAVDQRLAIGRPGRSSDQPGGAGSGKRRSTVDPNGG